MRDIEHFNAYQLNGQTGGLVRGITAQELKRRVGHEVEAMALARLLLWRTPASGRLEQLHSLDAPLAAAIGVSPAPTPASADASTAVR